MFTPLLLSLLLQAPATAPQSFEPSTIRNFVRASTDFCTGGQPRNEHFARLKAEGVRAVVNLRTPGEHRADEERQAVEQAGLRYFNSFSVLSTINSRTMGSRERKSRVTDDQFNG